MSRGGGGDDDNGSYYPLHQEDGDDDDNNETNINGGGGWNLNCHVRDQLEMELISIAPGAEVVRQDNAKDTNRSGGVLLQSISLKNFTGRIVFRHTPTTTEQPNPFPPGSIVPPPSYSSQVSLPARSDDSLFSAAVAERTKATITRADIFAATDLEHPSSSADIQDNTGPTATPASTFADEYEKEKELEDGQQPSEQQHPQQQATNSDTTTSTSEDTLRTSGDGSVVRAFKKMALLVGTGAATGESKQDAVPLNERAGEGGRQRQEATVFAINSTMMTSDSDHDNDNDNNNNPRFALGDVAVAAMNARKIKRARKNAKRAARLSNQTTSAVFRRILKEATIKHSIPPEIMRKRSQSRMLLLHQLQKQQRELCLRVSASLPSTTATTTPLHVLCSQTHSDDGQEVTLEALFECLKNHPTAIRTKDSAGRYPLHLIGDNETLITSDSGRNVATVFAGHLLNEFPEAATTPDKDGFVPFARVLADWIDWVNDQERMRKEEEEIVSSLQNRDVKDEPEEPRPTYYTGHKGGIFARNAADFHDATMHWHLRTAQRRFFPRVEVWEEVEWCLAMLSTVLDILARNRNVPMYQRLRRQALRELDIRNDSDSADQEKRKNQTDLDDDSWADERGHLVGHVIDKLPNLLTTVLLVEDDGNDTRTRILEKVLFRRLLLSPKVVGKWVIHMLNHGGVPARRAVDFLWLISHTSVDDYTGGFAAASSSSGDWAAFNKRREQVFDAVGNLKGTVASLVTLETKEAERAASTAVVWHIMGQKLSRPFILGLVLIDLVLHLTLMTSYRTVALRTSALNQNITVDANSVIFFITLHYLLRKGCEAWVILTVSTEAFKSYFSNMWTLFDLVAIILTIVATVLEEVNGEKYLTGLNVLITGLLWIKVLGFLKVVNKQMSTFVLALTQILLDIRLFMVVLFVCIIMFGEMFHVAVSTKDDGGYCSSEEFDSGAMEDFCGTSWESYLRTYAILLGDFELDEITTTSGMTVLFIMFTIFGVVILLNVLIAVISDSYEKATMSGALLFGRARVLYVAQNEALEEFLRPRTKAENEAHTSWNHCARKIIRWMVLLAILGTAIYAELFLLGVIVEISKIKTQYQTLALASIYFLVLFCALFVVVTFILDRVLRDVLPDRPENVYDMIISINSWFVRTLSNTLFGLNKEKIQTISNDESVEEEWTCRMKYLESVVERLVIQTKDELKAEILKMRAEMHEHFEEDDEDDDDDD